MDVSYRLVLPKWDFVWKIYDFLHICPMWMTKKDTEKGKKNLFCVFPSQVYIKSENIEKII